MAMAFASGAVAETNEKFDGAARQMTIKPSTGFIDTPVVLDDAGRNLAYIVSDGAGNNVVHVHDLAASKTLRTVDVSGLKATPVALAILDKNSIFVVGENAKGDEVGAVFEGERLKRKIGPATRIRKVNYDGRQVAAVYRARKRGEHTIHVTVARDLLTGKRVGKKTSLKLDANNRDAKRGFVLHYWADEHLTAVGTHEGRYDRKADQHMPDRHGRLDFVTGNVESEAITNVIEYRKRDQILRKHPNRTSFLDFARDRATLKVYDRGVPRDITLAEPINHYEPASIGFKPGAEGSLFFTLRIDPVHPDAAARRRAVPDWIDLYELKAGQSKAQRRARWLTESTESMTWLAGPHHWILLPRHRGFSRGGPRIEILSFGKRGEISKNE